MNGKEAIYTILQTEGITQSEAARRIGVSRQNICQALRIDNFSLENFLKICNALGYDVQLKKGRNTITVEPKDK